MYKGFVENKDFKHGDTKSITVAQQYIGNINSITDDITFPHGPIWNNINARILLSAEKQRTAEYRINKFGKLKLRNKNDFYGSVKNITDYTINYIGNQDLICYDYSVSDLVQSGIRNTDYYFGHDRINCIYGSSSLDGKNNIVRRVLDSTGKIIDSFEIYDRKTGSSFTFEEMQASLSKLFEGKSKIIPMCIIYEVYRRQNGTYWSRSDIAFNGTGIDTVYPPGGIHDEGVFVFYKQLLAVNTEKYGLYFTNAIDRNINNGGSKNLSDIFAIDKQPLITIANGVSESINRFSRGNIYNGGFINILKGNTSFNPNIELNIKFQDFRYDFQKYGLKNFESDEAININIERITNYSLNESLFDINSITTKISELDKTIEEFNSKSLKSSQLRAENSTFYTSDFIKYDTYYFVNNYSGSALSKLENIVKALNGELVHTD